MSGVGKRVAILGGSRVHRAALIKALAIHGHEVTEVFRDDLKPIAQRGDEALVKLLTGSLPEYICQLPSFEGRRNKSDRRRSPKWRRG